MGNTLFHVRRVIGQFVWIACLNKLSDSSCSYIYADMNPRFNSESQNGYLFAY